MHEHATKPGTLGAGLSDSPAGLAAWIGEKIVAGAALAQMAARRLIASCCSPP
jgi:hypothetical protein